MMSKIIQNMLDRLREDHNRIAAQIEVLEQALAAQNTSTPAQPSPSQARSLVPKKISVAARKSHWTPERRAAMSKKMKAKHAAKVRAKAG